MPQNRGKKFEEIIKQSFQKVPDTYVLRLPDQTNGFLGSTNPCDFIVYHYPYQYLIECKSIHGNTFPLNNVTKNQREGLLSASNVNGVIAGILIWWIDADVTKFIPIQIFEDERQHGVKSIRFDKDLGVGYQTEYQFLPVLDLRGKKRRVFFNYDMQQFFKEFSV